MKSTYGTEKLYRDLLSVQVEELKGLGASMHLV